MIVFIGLQGAGKSTFYRSYFAQTHVLVSKDLLQNNKRPAQRQRRLIEEALQMGQSVVVDNTNPTPEIRAELLQLGHLYNAEVIGYFFESNVRESLERNRQRQGKARVPDVAIYVTAKKLVMPTYTEGFDQLYIVRAGNDGSFIVHPLSRLEETTARHFDLPQSPQCIGAEQNTDNPVCPGDAVHASITHDPGRQEKPDADERVENATQSASADNQFINAHHESDGGEYPGIPGGGNIAPHH